MEYESVLAMEGSKPMIAKAIPKTSTMLKFRRSSCLYLFQSQSVSAFH